MDYLPREYEESFDEMLALLDIDDLYPADSSLDTNDEGDNGISRTTIDNIFRALLLPTKTVPYWQSKMKRYRKSSPTTIYVQRKMMPMKRITKHMNYSLALHTYQKRLGRAIQITQKEGHGSMDVIRSVAF